MGDPANTAGGMVLREKRARRAPARDGPDPRLPAGGGGRSLRGPGGPRLGPGRGRRAAALPGGLGADARGDHRPR
ncbi:MAG: hypothetical protein U5L11_11300 [Arhodomonas sp.]|nr:hypothetical protein [Arhodomonas sp.]